ncbi:MAG: hypothetical protein WAU07_02830 [Microgenomates group bacterium]
MASILATTRFPSALLPASTRLPIGLSFMIWISILALATGFSIVAQPEVPLFYSYAQPEQQLVQKEWLLLIPALSFLMNIINYAVVVLAREIDPLLITLFAWTMLFIQVIFGLSLGRIVYITI